MAEPLKVFFDRALVERIASSFAEVWPAFPKKSFVREASRGLDALELKARAGQIAAALGASLPADFPEAARVVVASLGPRHATDELEGAGMGPFFYLPHTMWVASAGLEHFDEAMAAQHELTQRFTCEFSVRPFLERYPERTLARLVEWTGDPSAHVRRLVSEGTRSRLPWASRVRWLDDHPERVLPLLEALKDDPSSMVRRSVANHLNDLGKHRPDLVLPLAARWLDGASEDRRKLVRHALRSAIKRGERGALALLGHGARPAIAATATMTPKRVRIGDAVRIAVTVESTSDAPQPLNLDLEVAFVKVRGERPKVFKLAQITLAPGAKATVEKRVSLAVHTTRTPRPGRHEVALLANGERYPVGAFSVVEPPTSRAPAS
jgi:3-methyladenine DNA glycosylase AlkC